MKVSLNRGECLAAISAVVGAIKSRPTMAILHNVRISTAEAGSPPILRFEATDLDITIASYVVLSPLDIDAPGVMLVDGKRLLDAVRAFSGENIAIEALGGVDGAGKVRLMSGGAMLTMPTDSVDAYPTLPDAEVGDVPLVDAKGLAHQLAQAFIAVSYDTSRPNLNGIYLIPRGKGALMAATDGHRLVQVVAEWSETPIAPALGESGMLIPTVGVGAIKRVLESGGSIPARMVIKGDGATFLTVECGRTTVIVRLIDGAFPDYRQVIPKTTARTLTLMKSVIIAALRRASVVSSERTHGVRFRVQGNKITVTSDNPDLGNSSETLTAHAVVGAEGELHIAFNAKYVTDALSVVDSENVRISFNDALAPAIVSNAGDDSLQCILMPMRI